MKALLPQGALIESLRLRRRPDWPAALAAGAAAGTIMALPLGVALGSIPEVWAFLRRGAAILLGPGVLAPPATFDLAIVVTAAAVHYALSAVYALVLADAVYRLQTRAAVWVGGIYGVVLYLINYHAFTMVFPWFVQSRGIGMALAHAAFGAVAAYCYTRFARAITTS